MSQREPIFNFSEPAPVWLCGFLILIHIIVSFAPEAVVGFLSNLGTLASTGTPLGNLRSGLENIPSLFLHGFLHADTMHLLFNSGMIAVFGVLICRTAGRGWRRHARFLAIFLISVCIGGLAQLLWWKLSGTPGYAIGASGGASGLFAAAAYVLGGNRQMIRWGLVWIVINALIVSFEYVGFSVYSTAWAAHLGGYVGGALLALFMLRPNSTDFRVTR